MNPTASTAPLAATAPPATQEGPILLFDGVCNLCNGAVQWVLLNDRSQRIRFLSLQDPKAAALLAPLGIVLVPNQLGSMILLDGGRVYRESDAVLRVGWHMGGLWRALSVVGRVLPRFVRNPLYRWVARNRYRWFGKRDECMLPRPEWRARFV